MTKKLCFRRLFGAYFIDFVITLFAAWLVWKLFWVCFPQAFAGLGKTAGIISALVLLVGCISLPNLVYFTECERRWEQTLGKRLFGMKVLKGSQRPAGKKLWGAYGIDFLLSVPVSTVCALMGLFLQAMIIFDGPVTVFDRCLSLGIILSCLSIIVLYFPVCEYFWGKTLGKKVTGLCVVQQVTKNKNMENNETDSVQYANLLFRLGAVLFDVLVGFICCFLSPIFLLFFGIGYTALEIWKGASLGKMVFGLSVNSAGETPLSRKFKFRRAVLSLVVVGCFVFGTVLGTLALDEYGVEKYLELAIAIGLLIPGVWGIISIFFSTKKQTFYDQWCGTVLVGRKNVHTAWRILLALAEIGAAGLTEWVFLFLCTYHGKL